MNGAVRGGRHLAFLLSMVGVLSSARARAEVIGIWDVEAPVSAVLLSGGGGTFFDWLNVVNVPIGIDDAFAGPHLLDGGYANLSTGTVVELNYGESSTSSLRNRPGDDLVLFDARFDANSFAVATSFDGFERELRLLAGGFLDTGNTRLYYYGGRDLPYTAEIWGAPFDLSALGVPEGEAVDAIRVRSLEDDGGDLIGVGAIRPIAEPSTLVLLLGATALAAARRRS
jgi:hypothetical protein